MSCGTCGVQASETMQEDTGVPAGAPQSQRPRCPYCQAFVSTEGASCQNPQCPGSNHDHAEWEALFAQLVSPPPPTPPPPLDPALEAALAALLAAGPPADPSASLDPALEAEIAALLAAAPPADPSAPRDPALEAEIAALLAAAPPADPSAPRDPALEAACRDPWAACRYARDVDQYPSAATRQAASQNPECACWYALHVDRAPRDDTRAGACQDPEWAYRYALEVDQAPRADTRASACQAAYPAYAYALKVDQAPSDATRNAAGQHPDAAYRYALEVDQAPRDDTRAAACQDPFLAYEYALEVDQAPRDDTRAAACQDPEWAYFYARAVDHGPHDDTRNAACQNPEWALEYARNVDESPRADTFAAACGDPQWAQEYRRRFPDMDLAAATTLSPRTTLATALAHLAAVSRQPADTALQAQAEQSLRTAIRQATAAQDWGAAAQAHAAHAELLTMTHSLAAAITAAEAAVTAAAQLPPGTAQAAVRAAALRQQLAVLQVACLVEAASAPTEAVLDYARTRVTAAIALYKLTRDIAPYAQAQLDGGHLLAATVPTSPDPAAARATAQAAFTAACQAARGQPHLREIHAEAASNLGSLAYLAGQTDQAATFYQEALGAYAQCSSPPPHAIAPVHTGLALLHQQQGALAAAQAHYQQAIALYQQAGDQGGEALVHRYYAALLTHAANPLGALVEQQRFQECCRQAGLDPATVEALFAPAPPTTPP